MKTMILAAGRGQRMGALTDHTPKPLLRVGKHALIEHLILRLASHGFTDIVMNVSYLAEKIMHALGDGARYGVTIEYSYEPKALGTGGGIFQALPLLGSDPFLAVSADLFTDFPFQQLPKKINGLAHVVLTDNPPFHPEGDYGLDAEQKLIFTPPQFNYAGISVLHPDLFQSCKQGEYSVIPVLNKAIEHRAVTGEHYRGLWMNVGDPEELAKAQFIYSELL